MWDLLGMEDVHDSFYGSCPVDFPNGYANYTSNSNVWNWAWLEIAFLQMFGQFKLDLMLISFWEDSLCTLLAPGECSINGSSHLLSLPIKIQLH